MKLPINHRLLACCRYVHPGDRIADVGCDHGYLGIHLLQIGMARSVIASDLREGPLQSARENAAKYGLSHQMTFHLSDGLQNVPRDFDTLVCAGMGAETMISILEAATWIRSSRYRMILQCQSKVHLLRKYLSDTGWFIRQESVQRDGKFLYTVMEILWEPAAPRLTPGQCYASPAMLREDTPEMWEHFRWIYQELHKLVTCRGDAATEHMVLALKELTPLYETHKEEKV